jgi:hypothetical protein
MLKQPLERFRVCRERSGGFLQQEEVYEGRDRLNGKQRATTGAK